MDGPSGARCGRPALSASCRPVRERTAGSDTHHPEPSGFAALARLEVPDHDFRGHAQAKAPPSERYCNPIRPDGQGSGLRSVGLPSATFRIRISQGPSTNLRPSARVSGKVCTATTLPSGDKTACITRSWVRQISFPVVVSRQTTAPCSDATSREPSGEKVTSNAWYFFSLQTRSVPRRTFHTRIGLSFPDQVASVSPSGEKAA